MLQGLLGLCGSVRVRKIGYKYMYMYKLNEHVPIASTRVGKPL